MDKAKLEAVIARLCQESPLSMTHAVKLPYLVDVMAKRALGCEIIGATYETWDYGVVAKEAWALLHYPPASLSVQVLGCSEAGFCVSSKSLPSVLSRDEEAVVDLVAEKYRQMSASALGALTKEMNPQVPEDAWGSNLRASTGEEAYFRLSVEWNHTRLNLLLHNCDFDDRSKWSGPITDPSEYVRKALS